MDTVRKHYKAIIVTIIFLISFVKYDGWFDNILVGLEIAFMLSVTLIGLILSYVAEDFVWKKILKKEDDIELDIQTGIEKKVDNVIRALLKKKKLVLLISFAVLASSVGIGAIYNYQVSYPKVKSPYASSEVNGLDYQKVTDKFDEAGFDSIEYTKLDIDSVNELTKAGQVENVTIKGKNRFDKDDSFRSNAEVTITYYTSDKTTVGLSSEEIVGDSLSDVRTHFERKGFCNIEYVEEKQLPSDEERGLVTGISVSGKTKFDDDFLCDINDKVVISYYSAKYDVELKVSCRENLLLSKYDVNVYVDDELIDTIEHGKSLNTVIGLEAGKHQIRFEQEGDSTVKGETEFVADDNTKCKFKVVCHYDYIDIDEIMYIKVPVSSTGAQDYTYKKLKKMFEDAGFSKIEIKKVADLDSTNLKMKNKVEAIKIGNNVSFTEEDKFFENTKIIITYHSPIEVELPSSLGMNYDEYILALQNAGFVDVSSKSYETDTEGIVNGSVNKVIVNGEVASSGDKVAIDKKISVEYYSVKEKVVYTIDTCEELSNLLLSGDYEVYTDFAGKYAGEIIEFDASIDDAVRNSNGDSYDVLVSAWDYNENSQKGPTFKFDNVKASSVAYTRGKNIRVRAKVDRFDYEHGIFYLRPINLTER